MAATDTLRDACVALAKASGAFAMSGLSMGIVRMQSCFVRPVRVAHDFAEVEPVVVSDFTPALPRLVHCYEVVEALARGVGQQVCSLQLAEAESGRCLFRLERTHRNPGLVGNPRQHTGVGCLRDIGAQCQETYYDD